MASWFSCVVGMVKTGVSSMVSSAVSMVGRLVDAVFGTCSPVPETSVVVVDPVVCVVAVPVAVAAVAVVPAAVLSADRVVGVELQGRGRCAAQAQEFAGDALPAAERYVVPCMAPVCAVLPDQLAPPPVSLRRSRRVPRLPVRYTDVPVRKVKEPVLNAPVEIRTRSGRVVRRPERLSY